ncbi:PfkB family carbohydrate kinase [Paraferrimonas sp. SM1919]|uniref:PfkB family carbohydrate kinase n=1 Tax=Paraferrimonas sp. SM1919 TaxID=2662263 RepID=UPI0013D57F36|nr:PfkB family carbohydrate kinase [Paraferrimonas sp. SM1919]
MPKLLLLANLNIDKVLHLQQDLQTGGRHYYQQQSKRLGGGGANTGVPLVWAGFDVSIQCQLGNDSNADWIISTSNQNGLDCRYVQKIEGPSRELLLMLTPDGERTIVRPDQAPFSLADRITSKNWNAIYFNTHAQNAPELAKAACQQSIVFAQYLKKWDRLSCHYLFVSLNDLSPEQAQNPWAFAQNYAGEHLKGLILTKGNLGAELITKDSCYQQSAPNVEVVDTTGAGDVFAAAVIAARVNQLPPQQWLIQGNLWASYALTSSSSLPSESLKTILCK